MASLWELMAAREDEQMAQYADRQRQRTLDQGLRDAVANRAQSTTFAAPQQEQTRTLSGLAPQLQADPSLTEITGRAGVSPEQATFDYLRENDPMRAQEYAGKVMSQAHNIALAGDHKGAVDHVNKSLGMSLEYQGSKGDLLQVKNQDGTVLLYNATTGEEKVIGTPQQPQPPDHETWGDPYETSVGGKRAMVQKSSRGRVQPVIQDTSTTIKVGGGGMPTSKPPAGYRYTAGGDLEPIPGGPAAQKTVTAAKAQEGAVQSITTALEAARGLLSHTGRKSATGRTSLFNAAAIPGGARKTFLNDLETFKSQMFVPMVQQLKGMGQLSDAEGKKLLAAVGNLETTSSEGAFVANLNKVIRDLEQTLARTSQPIAAGPTGKQPARNANPQGQTKKGGRFTIIEVK